MPICKREGFDNMPSRNKDETFHDNDEVFFCEVTKEIFRDYEDYFRHVMVINSTVWQCEITGRDNLTYAEALRSERLACKKMELFKDSLRPPVMLVIEHAKQSSLNTLSALIAKFLRKRFFLNEEVTACHKSTTYNAYVVLDVVPPSKTLPANGVYEETEKLQYRLQRKGQEDTVVVVPFEKIRRQRNEFTIENLQMFVKDNVTRVDGILRPKPESYKKYVTDRKITFESIFIGKMPHFTPSKIKRPNQDNNSKKQSTLNKYWPKNGGKENEKLTEEEIAIREKQLAEKEAARIRLAQEELERTRQEKLERIAEMERQKRKKRAKLLERIENECTALLTKTDDLERTDQRLLPLYKPINTLIPKKLVGDAFMIREFMHSFASLMSGIETFRDNLNFYEMSRAFTVREVAGPLSDIIIVLISTIFDLQKEEEEDCSVDYLLLRRETRKNEMLETMSKAARAHIYAKRHFSFKINELPVDALTLSEVVRLHLLSSGAAVKERVEKWRMQYRNGYVSSEDPGLTFRMRHPHILRALKIYPIYHLSFRDIMRILRCLMSQALTYSSMINLNEERKDEMNSARSELRLLTETENRRLANLQIQKRIIASDINQLSSEADEDKKRQMEEKLNKKSAELLAQSDRDHRRYKNEIENLNSNMFNFLVYLGMDRAYRKYYVLNSIPGLFVEHAPDSLDTCLSDPPTNKIVEDGGLSANRENLPKNRKDLRAYLMKMYTDEEKKAAAAEKLAAKLKKKTGTNTVSQENKEDKENHLVNGLTNGHDSAATVEGSAIDETKIEETSATPPAPPTQYQLYMCTGDPHNCIVHDERNADRQRWAYIYEREEIDALIDGLNPLGYRESQLREQLKTLRELIVSHTKRCPFDMLTLKDSKAIYKFRSLMMSDTYRKYSKSNFGYLEEVGPNEIIHAVLLDRIIQLESNIYTGDLGRLKVKDMEKWRMDLQNSEYDPQVKLQWGFGSKSVTGSNEEEDDVAEEDDEEFDPDTKKGKPYQDPGEGLGDTLEIDSEDSDEDTVSLHESETMQKMVRDCASALLQVEQAIERRFIKEPFGAPIKELKDKNALERILKWGAFRLRQWEVSLMESTSYSQVFLHLNILHDCILWARSTNKSYCQVCRRGSDPDKMLLCDECNGGTHMFCMKPPMKTVPEGNWYCKKCVNRLGLQNEQKNSKRKSVAQKRKRKFSMDTDENSVDAEQTASKDDERRSGGRRTSKRLHSNEIEEVLSDEDSNEGNNDADDSEESATNDTEVSEEESADEEMSAGVAEKSEDKSVEEEDENVCVVCSYDGSDLICIRCKDTFHLECINLKRPPRYNYICPKCKSGTNGEKKSPKRTKSNGRHAANSSNEDEDDDLEPLAKKTRHSRSSLRLSNSHQINGNASPREVARSTGHRRSNRRTGDNLPLNNSALYELLDDVMKHEYAWPFLRPVSQAEVPDYHKIIKEPMDLAKVKSKLNMGAYQLNEEVMKDIQLIFTNCDHYNIKDNEIYCAGSKLEKYIMEQCKRLHLPFKPSDMNS